ncbi:MAG TPA: hypothetical protein VF883_13910 [Thermoanaerobaculia bacterium]|jgi:hypothetical protein
MIPMGRAAAGSLFGAALAAAAAPLVRPLFSIPAGGVGPVTIAGYPKSWDYAVVALLILGAFAGGVLASWRARGEAWSGERPESRLWPRLTLGAIVFAVMFFAHDHPYALMDPFHEGEHLTAGWLMKSGARPYGDFYVFHGLAVDAGLDAMVLGDPPSPLRPRRLQTLLDAATLALLVPIAAEVTVTMAGLIAGVLVSLCACAALWLPVFPYFRLAPVLLAVLGLLRYARSGRSAPLFLALASSTLGVLWSLDTGLFAVAGTAAAIVVLRVFRLETKPLPWPRVLALGAVAALLPLVVLIAVRADLRQFFVDSFVVMPRAIDALWALPAPAPLTANGVRYYLPPVFYGFALVLGVVAMRRGDKRFAANVAIVMLFSILLFRTAAGRAGWSHTRFAVPLLGIAVVAFVVEPLFRTRRGTIAAALLAAPLFIYFEVRENVVAGAKLIAGWSARQQHDGLVPYPLATGRGIYTTPDNANDLAALAAAVDALGPGTIFDFSNERALYYLLQRKPATRCMEVSMLSVPSMLSEAMGQLNANPPVCVIVRGYPEIEGFDGVTNTQRVPELARWIEATYPKRMQIGRFVVATR